jgi:hypothetical protein
MKDAFAKTFEEHTKNSATTAKTLPPRCFNLLMFSGPLCIGYQCMQFPSRLQLAQLPWGHPAIPSYATTHGISLTPKSSPVEHGRHFLSQLANAVLTFALRGERQPWGAEDTAFVFRETFKAAPTDAQKAYDAILVYARKRPIVKQR